MRCFLLLVAFTFLWFVAGCDVLLKPPSDRELLGNFERHETALNQVVQMVKANKQLMRVDTDWTDPKDPQTIGVSSDRIEQYRRLLREAHVPRGFLRRGDADGIEFTYWVIGSAISSDTIKG